MEPEFKTVSFDLKAVEGESGHGQFEAILSTPDLDRDGENISPGAFQPLPKSIPVHFAHDFVDKVPPIGRAEPFYDGDVLKVRGSFASTPRAQELRSLVNEGVIDSMSAGFITTKRKGKNIIGADLIEGSLTATPVNRNALLLRSKALADAEFKAGARNSASDSKLIQSMHDTATELGATCSGMKSEQDAETKAVAEEADAEENSSEEGVAATGATEKSVTPAATAPDDESTTQDLRARLLRIDAEVAAS